MGESKDGPMGDQELAALFRTAVTDVPPAGFAAADVVAASRRATGRRRAAVAGSVVAVLLIGGGVGGALVASGGATATTSAAVGAAPDLDGRGAPAQPMAPELATVPPADTAAPLGPGNPGGCASMQDPALRALVDAALPQVRDAVAAPTPMLCRIGGGREVHLEVVDGDASGLLSVVYDAPGEQTTRGLPVGWAQADAPTASGGHVTVTSAASADSGAVPFRDRLAAVAEALAPRL